eukprot:m.142424 g.142424  ORF g.142424 m.142424 type:complete len:285 (+) comp14878_c0_seq4:190-1044(+)
MWTALDHMLAGNTVKTNEHLQRFLKSERLLNALINDPLLESWKHIKKIKKELTEAYAALAAIEKCLASMGIESGQLVFFDFCAGKGLLSMVLASKYPGAEIHMFDNCDKLNLDHLKAQFLKNVNYHHVDLFAGDMESILESVVFPATGGRVIVPVFVGIHLCGALACRAISLCKEIMARHATLNGNKSILVLAPCCLPRRRRHDVPGKNVVAQSRKLGVSAYTLWSTFLYLLLPAATNPELNTSTEFKGSSKVFWQKNLSIDESMLSARNSFITLKCQPGMSIE